MSRSDDFPSLSNSHEFAIVKSGQQKLKGRELSLRQQQCLRAMGIRILEHNPTACTLQRTPGHSLPTLEKIPDKPAASAPPPVSREAIPLNNWQDINQAIHQCQACVLAQNCNQKVPGIGPHTADLLIIGEGPGEEENLKGEPFVGRSGQLLDKILTTINLTRLQVYITNIVKCRPPNNRDPKAAEIQSCAQFLQAQIRQIQPKVILSVGRISAHSLLNTTEPVRRLVQKVHYLPDSNIPLKVTYHPAYLLRNPAAKATVWQDMKTLHHLLGR